LLSRVTRFSARKRWGLELAKRRGLKRAKLAVARKLAVILPRTWIDGSTCRWTKTEAGLRMIAAYHGKADGSGRGPRRQPRLRLRRRPLLGFGDMTARRGRPQKMPPCLSRQCL